MGGFLWNALKEGLSLWFGWIAILSAAIGVFSLVLKKALPKITVPQWINTVSLVVLIMSVFFGILVGAYNIHTEDLEAPRSFAVPDQLLGPHLEGLDIRIVDLAREDLLIQNRTFVNCRIYGPAVVYPEGCVFTGIGVHVPSNYLDDDPVKTIYIPLPDRDYLSGIVYLKNITFRDCGFKDISFIGPRQLEKDLREAMAPK